MPNLARFRGLRKRAIKAFLRNPKGRPRHETVDVSLYLKKTNTKYVDFREDSVEALSREQLLFPMRTNVTYIHFIKIKYDMI